MICQHLKQNLSQVQSEDLNYLITILYNHDQFDVTNMLQKQKGHVCLLLCCITFWEHLGFEENIYFSFESNISSLLYTGFQV